MTKKQQKDKFKKMLTKQHLTEEDKQELRLLFKKHPYYGIKRGCGIKDIFVGKTTFKTSAFFIQRNDLSITDISYLRCIDGERTKLSHIKTACRSAIKSIILSIKSKVKYGIDRCEFTNEILTSDNTHIDHYDMKFRDLFKKWIQGKDIDYLFSQLNDTTIDLVDEIYFKNSDINNDFIAFHNENTHLRAISKTANLKLK